MRSCSFTCILKLSTKIVQLPKQKLYIHLVVCCIMSLADVALILQAYAKFKETYRKLRENEEALRDVLEEIFLYEELIAMYSNKITKDPLSSQSAFVLPIRKFASGVEGFRLLLSEYSYHKGPIAKAWNCCAIWCCTEKNSARIKKFTEVWPIGNSHFVFVHLLFLRYWCFLKTFR